MERDKKLLSCSTWGDDTLMKLQNVIEYVGCSFTVSKLDTVCVDNLRFFIFIKIYNWVLLSIE